MTIGLDDIKGWWLAVAGIVTGGTGVGMTMHKVKTHDRVLFKKNGGLNLVSVDSCSSRMDECRRHITRDVGKIIEEKLKEHNNEMIMDNILKELKKLNGASE